MIFCFVSVASLTLLTEFSFAEEPRRFTYDDKLLDKIIRMELKVEQVQKEMKQTQTNVVKALEKVTQVLVSKTTELDLLESRVDMPMVAFSAYNPVDQSLDTNQILILQSVRLNKGAGYDDVIGIFTAPVTGLYLFTAHVCNYSGRGIYYDIILEHNPIAKSTKLNTAQYDCSTVSVITIVTASQRVWIKCTSGGSSNQLYEDSHRQTTFSGVLLQKMKTKEH